MTVDNCASAGNWEEAEQDQVPAEKNSCYDAEESPYLGADDADLEVDRDTLLADETDDIEDVDVATDQFYDAECADEKGKDTVSDSLSFDAGAEEDVDELPESQSDSVLCRLPVRLDAVQELSDSGTEDVATERSSDLDPHVASSSNMLSPTSPSSPVFDHEVAAPHHRRSESSPDSCSKPPPGAAFVTRKSARSESLNTSPKSPEYAIVQGHKVELRPPKMAAVATKRVSSFRKSLIKYAALFGAFSHFPLILYIHKLDLESAMRS